MESEKVNDIVEETFTKVDLSVMNKHHGLNWKGWRKRSIPTHSGWLYPLTFDAGKGLKEA